MQILVLDACSRDHTIQFARAAGANVIQREWTDFVDARTFALSQVTTPWTLMIDADEALDDVLCAAILSASGEPNGYRLRRTTYFCGKPMRVWRNELLLRLFRTGRARLQAHPAAGSDAAVHEGWVCDGPAPELPGTLLHYSYPDVSTYRIKYERYTSIEARELPPSLGRVFTTAAASFPRLLWLLLRKGALLDGPRGWYVAYRSALYPAVAARKAFLR